MSAPADVPRDAGRPPGGGGGRPARRRGADRRRDGAVPAARVRPLPGPGLRHRAGCDRRRLQRGEPAAQRPVRGRGRWRAGGCGGPGARRARGARRPRRGRRDRRGDAGLGAARPGARSAACSRRCPAPSRGGCPGGTRRSVPVVAVLPAGLRGPGAAVRLRGAALRGAPGAPPVLLAGASRPCWPPRSRSPRTWSTGRWQAASSRTRRRCRRVRWTGSPGARPPGSPRWCVPLLGPVRRAGVHLRVSLRFPPGVGRQVAVLAFSGVGGLIAQQLAAVLIMLTAQSAGPHGTYTVFVYTQAVYLLPYAVLIVPLATSTFPRLSALAHEREPFARLASATTRGVAVAGAVGAGSAGRDRTGGGRGLRCDARRGGDHRDGPGARLDGSGAAGVRPGVPRLAHALRPGPRSRGGGGRRQRAGAWWRSVPSWRVSSCRRVRAASRPSRDWGRRSASACSSVPAVLAGRPAQGRRAATRCAAWRAPAGRAPGGRPAGGAARASRGGRGPGSGRRSGRCARRGCRRGRGGRARCRGRGVAGGPWHGARGARRRACLARRRVAVGARPGHRHGDRHRRPRIAETPSDDTPGGPGPDTRR